MPSSPKAVQRPFSHFAARLLWLVIHCISYRRKWLDPSTGMALGIPRSEEAMVTAPSLMMSCGLSLLLRRSSWSSVSIV